MAEKQMSEFPPKNIMYLRRKNVYSNINSVRDVQAFSLITNLFCFGINSLQIVQHTLSVRLKHNNEEEDYSKKIQKTNLIKLICC